MSVPNPSPAGFPANSTPLSGTLTFSGGTIVASNPSPTNSVFINSNSAMIGPFSPQLARAIWATLVGSNGATGSAQILRSTDGGNTLNGLTAGGSQAVGGSDWGKWSFASLTGVIANEKIDDETSGSASWYLSVSLTAGTLTYNLGQ